MSDQDKVVILGGGPGAVFAYYGALAAGMAPRDVVIWAKELTYPRGAFWLHTLPPNSPTRFPAEPMSIYLSGTAEEYSRKQWGAVFPTSVDTYAGQVLEVYNPNVVLPALWETANKEIMDIKWTQDRIEVLSHSCKAVIVTFPITPEATSLMRQSNSKIPVYVAPTEDPEGWNACIYNGNPLQLCVRVTRAFGHLCIEYPRHNTTPPEELCRMDDLFYGTRGKVVSVPELHPTVEPIKQRIYGHKGNILVTGRWATLDRKALSHHSWDDTFNFLNPLGAPDGEKPL